MPLPKIPIQGDIGKLESLSSGTKRSGGTFGEVVQRTPAGRPEGSTTTPQGPSQGAEVAPEFSETAQTLAEIAWARQMWEPLVNQSPTPYVRAMKSIVDAEYERLAGDLYQATSNFEY